MAEKPQSPAPPKTSSTPMGSTTGESPALEGDSVDERRRRLGLRRLIDEMLAEIRAAANEENWTPNARSQAERDLARIMDQVKAEAMRGNGPTPTKTRTTPAKKAGASKQTATRGSAKSAKSAKREKSAKATKGAKKSGKAAGAKSRGRTSTSQVAKRTTRR